MGDAERLGGHGGTEVDLVAYYDVWVERSANLGYALGPLPRDPAGEDGADHCDLVRPVGDYQGTPVLRRGERSSAAVDGLEASPAHGIEHPGLAGVEDVVARGGEGAGHRQRRPEVP